MGIRMYIWDHFGVALGSLWVTLESNLLTFGYLGFVFGVTLGSIRLTLAHFGSIWLTLGHFVSSLGSLRVSLGSVWGHFGVALGDLKSL